LWSLLHGNLLIDNYCCASKSGRTMDIASRRRRAYLFHEGKYDSKHSQVKQKVSDGNPVLQRCPIMGKYYPKVLCTDEDSDDHPQDEEAVVSQMSSEYQQQRTTNTEEAIKDSIFNNGSNTDIFIITLSPKIIVECSNSSGILDNVEDGGDDGDDQFNDADYQDRRLQ